MTLNKTFYLSPTWEASAAWDDWVVGCSPLWLINRGSITQGPSQKQDRNGAAGWGGVFTHQPHRVELGGPLMNFAPSACYMDRSKGSLEEFWTTSTMISRGWFSALSEYWDQQSAFIKVPASQSHRVWLHSPGRQPGCLQFFKIPPVILMLRWIKKHSVTFWEGGSAEPQERAWWVGGTVAWSEPGGWTEGGRQGQSLRLGQTPILKSSGKLRKG